MQAQITNEDPPVLNDMHLDELLLVPWDKAMNGFMRAVLQYPRVTMTALERSVSVD